MRKSLKRILAALLLVTLLCTVPTALAATRKAKVVAAAMKVYSAPGKNYLGVIGRGKTINVTGTSGSYVSFKFKGQGPFYAKKSDISYTSGSAATTKRNAPITFVTRSSWKQSKCYKGTLSAGTTVYICGQKGSKYLVTNARRSVYGYISKSAF